MRRKYIYVGVKPQAFNEVIKFEELKYVHTFALEGSFLHTRVRDTDFEHTIFRLKDKRDIIRKLTEIEYDILISGGCPFILPVSKIKKPHQLFVNTHRSFLPDLRGRHPVNGALLHKRRFTGVTMHYLDDGIDTGNIIYQERFEITDDLDLGILHQALFDLEAKVFTIGMRRIIEANYEYPGEIQVGTDSYYSRSEKDMRVDFESMSDDELMTRVRAFGVKSQGVSCTINDECYKIFDAETVSNDYLLEKYAGFPCGALLLEYEDELLVKTGDGLIRVTSYEKK